MDKIRETAICYYNTRIADGANLLLQMVLGLGLQVGKKRFGIMIE